MRRGRALSTPPPSVLLGRPRAQTGLVTHLTVVPGDITLQQVDAVVNAANSAMRGGGGVDGAVHRAGGPAVLRDCVERFPDGLATGDAGWTTAGDMPATWVIHTVGPNYAAGQRDRALLDSCYRRALQVADELGARTVAFPLISAGVYGWPRADAIAAAVETILDTASQVEEARLVAFDEATFEQIRAQALLRQPVATAADTVGSLFEHEVDQWGLRGDTYLWRELRRRVADLPLPPTESDLRSLLEAAIGEILGTPLGEADDVVYLPAFDPGHGMSAGSVSTSWWRETGVPTLLNRFAAASGSSAPTGD